MTEPDDIEPSFSEDLAAQCISVRITSGMPKLSATIGEITSAAIKQFDLDNDKFDNSFSSSLMPKSKKTRLRQFTSDMRSALKTMGLAKIDEGRGVEYLVMLEDLPDLYAKYDEIHSDMLSYLTTDVLSDWDKYKETVIESLGNIDNPERYFPYSDKEQYAKEFKLNIHVSPMTSSSMLPSALVDEYLREKVEESMKVQTHAIRTRLRESLAEELVVLRERLLHTDTPLSSKTFNAINKAMNKSEMFSLGHDETITRVVAGVTKIVKYLTSNPEKIAEESTKRSCEALFIKCFTLLGDNDE